MTLKPNNNPHTGRVLLRLAPRKHDRCAREWKQCCFIFFFNHQGICIMNLLLKVSNQDFYLAILRHMDDAVWREAGASTTIMHLLTRYCQLDNSCQNIQFPLFHNPRTYLTPHPTFFYSLNSKLPLKEDFRQWTTSSLMWQMTWRWYHKHPLYSASESGQGGGTCILLCKGTILKGIIFNKL
jgi:hypothetical protein